MEEKFIYFVLFRLRLILKTKLGSGAKNLFSLSSEKFRSGSQIFVVAVVTNILSRNRYTPPLFPLRQDLRNSFQLQTYCCMNPKPLEHVKFLSEISVLFAEVYIRRISGSCPTAAHFSGES